MYYFKPCYTRKKGTHKDLIEKLMKEGYIRVRIDGEIKYLEELEPLDKNKKHTIDVVVDRIVKMTIVHVFMIR